MKKILFAFTILLIGTSCKKSHENPVVIPEPTVEISLLEPKVVLGTVLQGDVNFNLLGYGYDVTGKYDDASSARAPVVDITSFARDKPIPVSTSPMFGVVSYDAENAESLAIEFSDRLSQTQGRKLYGATINSFFPEEKSFSNKYVYGFYSDQSNYKRIAFYLDSSTKKYLSAGFKADLQNMNAEELVKKYGTHLLSDIALGAKLDIVYQAEVTGQNRYGAQRIGYDVALKAVFGRLPDRFSPT